jgi:pimeloyl-ACP methyl ester carboxylesterase
VTPTSSKLVQHRYDTASDAAILFLHGFLGKPRKTWTRFPQILQDDRRLDGWNIFSLGYSTGLWLDVPKVWKSDPDIGILARLLNTRVRMLPLKHHRTLVLIAHSMGGLVVQKALLDSPDLVDRVHAAFLFGTPSSGLGKAQRLWFWKRQLRDLGADSAFIKHLRRGWDKSFGRRRPFRFYVVAGSDDQFVPPESSLACFPKRQCHVIQGDHLSIVHARDAQHEGVAFVTSALVHRKVRAPGASAEIAARILRSRHTVRRLHRRKDLDDRSLVRLALALEDLRRRDEAIEVMERRLRFVPAEELPGFTDSMGTLAGRYKRRWIALGSHADGARAMALYAKAYKLAGGPRDPDQLLYLGINLAFMTLAFRRKRGAARDLARAVLRHCASGPAHKRWALAAEAEAHLILGHPGLALKAYGKAVAARPTNDGDDWRERLSIYEQAVRVANLVGDTVAAPRLDDLFLGGGAA